MSELQTVQQVFFVEADAKNLLLLGLAPDGLMQKEERK